MPYAAEAVEELEWRDDLALYQDRNDDAGCRPEPRYDGHVVVPLLEGVEVRHWRGGWAMRGRRLGTEGIGAVGGGVSRGAVELVGSRRRELKRADIEGGVQSRNGGSRKDGLAVCSGN